MISLIRGVVRYRQPNTIVLDVQGVGYELLCTQESYDRAPQTGEEYELMTRLIVREDSMTLFGFSSGPERHLFDQITSVSGIGPKTGITILSAIGSAPLREAIRTSDIGRLVGVPGVGRKTAERLVVELRDKLLKEEFDGSALLNAATSSSIGSSDDGPPNTQQIRADALQALMSLGYQRPVAEKAIRSVLRDSPEAAQSVEQLIKASLKWKA